MLLLLSLYSLFAEAQEIPRIWVLGNTADIPEGHVYWTQLKAELASQAAPVYLLLTGDLVPHCKQQEAAYEHLETIFDLVRGLPHVRLGLLTGDRDWDDSGPSGWNCVRDLEAYTLRFAPDNVEWLVSNGCPGPELIDIHPKLRLVALNTQWWNHPHRKPRPADALCDEIVADAIQEELYRVISTSRDRNVLIAGHFPPYSFGEYGGRFPLSTHLLPPLIGGMRAAFHEHIGGPRDISNHRFQKLRNQLFQLSAEFDKLIFLSGHEANQQVVTYQGNSLINSGAPLEASYVKQSPAGRLLLAEAGFMELTFAVSGQVDYTWVAYRNGNFLVQPSATLYQSPCDSSRGKLPTNNIPLDCGTAETARQPTTVSLPDSSLVTAGAQYAAGPLQRWFFGDHYRSTWTQPITVPVLPLDSMYGGLEVASSTRSRQTSSLELRSADSLFYIIRPVDKDPQHKLIPPLRSTIAVEVTRDQISAQHPYGALIVAPLAEQLGLLQPAPQLFLLPDVPALGRQRSKLGGSLGLLAVNATDDGRTAEHYDEADAIYTTYDLFQTMYDNPDLRLDDHEFALARLLDLLIGDWSRDEENWKWAAYVGEDSTLVRPIAVNRDYAFAKLDGILPWLASREWAIPYLEPFQHKINSVRSLSYQARHLDRYLGISLTRQDWLAAARRVQQLLSPELITAAVREMPEPAYPQSGAAIRTKLLQRREDLPTYALRLYELLARRVDIPGSNLAELFQVQRLPSGKTRVEIRKQQDSTLLFRRVFYPGETSEINLYGLNGSDRFEIVGSDEARIALRLIGGPGIDDYRDLSGGERLYIYDRDSSAMQLKTSAKRVHKSEDALYFYDQKSFAYHDYQPTAYFSFSSFNGFELRGGVRFIRRHYDRRPYSSRHELDVRIGTVGSFSFAYGGRLHHALGNWDWTWRASVARPRNFNNFFGLGDTGFDEALFADDFYRIRLNTLAVGSGLQLSFWKRSHLAFSGGFTRFDLPVEAGRVLDRAETPFGIGKLNLLHLQADAELDLRDHERFPTRGYRLGVEQEIGLADGESYGTTDLYLEYFLSHPLFPLTLGIRSGYGRSYGAVPFYKRPQLGQDQHLRGYQRNRFTGEQRLYLNTELRIPLLEWKTPIVPFDVGLRAFYDQGRLLSSNEELRTDWKQSFGGGIYLIPLSRSYTLSVLAGFSKDEPSVLNVQLGTNF